jgi:DNA repair exonuclease SbcCD ATPase subunit
MAEIFEICEKIEEKSTDLRRKTTARHWAEFSRGGFIYNASTIIPELEEIQNLFKQIENIFKEKKIDGLPDITKHIEEISKLTATLQRNKEMEEARMNKIKKQGIEGMADSITTPELYSDLEQKTLAILLKSAYLVDKLRIIDRKKEPIMQTKAVQRNMLEILEKREEEIQELRKKYDEIRKNTFMGIIQKENSIELEHQLNELSRKMEGKTSAAKKTLENSKTAFEQLEQKTTELNAEMNEMDEIQSQLTSKTFELITMLKKERDYAKKVLLEIEQETLQLRGTYSKELLNLQEEKMAYKNELENKYKTEIERLKKELKEKTEHIKNLQEAILQREKKINEIEEAMHQAKLIAKTMHRHQKIKEIFNKKTKEAEKNKENEE